VSDVAPAEDYRLSVRTVAVVLAVLSVLCLGWANASQVTVHREGPNLDCGNTAQVALYGPDLPPDTPRPYISRRRCERAAIQRLVGWGLFGWGLLGAALLVPRRRVREVSYPVDDHLNLDRARR
jgi:hypothetical protein